MKKPSIQFLFHENSEIKHELFEHINLLLKCLTTIKKELQKGYKTPYASLNLPSDTELFNTIEKTVEDKKKLNPTLLIVIGIGGSNLGAKAIHEALHGKLYNLKAPSIKILWADTTASDNIFSIATIMEKELIAGKNILLTVISKSGSTTETAANFQILSRILKIHKKDNYHEFIVTITDRDSALWHLAHEKKYTSLEIPQDVGGRYSVFSAAGLFPLGMLDINLKELLLGAQSIIDQTLSQEIHEQPEALSASLLAYYYHEGLNVHDTFLFSIDLEGIGAWYRQLMGESIGKEYDIIGKKVDVGITPTISIGSTDLHSVGQLYLGGPRDKFTTFIFNECSNYNLLVEKDNLLVSSIAEKSLDSIMHAIFQGVCAAYKKKQLPFVSFIIPEKKAYYIGQLLQLKMIEIMYLGYLLNINPFDQPNVELYKQETREILSHV
jgi:glucose-6-phosphate isomerase